MGDKAKKEKLRDRFWVGRPAQSRELVVFVDVAELGEREGGARWEGVRVEEKRESFVKKRAYRFLAGSLPAPPRFRLVPFSLSQK